MEHFRDPDSSNRKWQRLEDEPKAEPKADADADADAGGEEGSVPAKTLQWCQYVLMLMQLLTPLQVQSYNPMMPLLLTRDLKQGDWLSHSPPARGSRPREP